MQQKSTQGSDATAPKTPEQGQVTEQGNTKDAAKAKVSSVAESPELQESFQKGAAKEAGKVHFTAYTQLNEWHTDVARHTSKVLSGGIHQVAH